MSLSDLSSAQLTRLISLVKQKEHILAQLSKVDAEVQTLESGAAVRQKPGRPPGRPSTISAVTGKKGRRRSKRLKNSLLKALAAAGSSGITVKELSGKLGVKPGNVFSWFYTTGKKIKGIKKVGEAKYSYHA